MSEDRGTLSVAWIYTYDRQTGRFLSSRRAGVEELPGPAGSPPTYVPYGCDAFTTYTYYLHDPAPPRFEHDPAARVFRLTKADGTVEAFRDNPTRYLCVEPDPDSGELRPVMKLGQPVYLRLCREDREAR